MNLNTNNFTLISHTPAPKPVVTTTPTPSGKGQRISRCPKFWTPLYSRYGGGTSVVFIREGTLGEGDRERGGLMCILLRRRR
ncbi:hypothetical protein CC80DRAFT_495887 [Byssothecium circinans]|uniref:Uncharacterized protein n=1 Tax=Byssothecium circinans TaxID=147558 RepID=A0A6A5THT7_9PLEO|nr:hypothetical protein CC80DRAFT_495887 [Byssothecium circinans]